MLRNVAYIRFYFSAEIRKVSRAHSVSKSSSGRLVLGRFSVPRAFSMALRPKDVPRVFTSVFLFWEKARRMILKKSA